MLLLDTFNILHAAPAAGFGRLDASQLKGWIAAGRFGSEHCVMVYDGASPSQTLRHAAEPGVAVPSKSSGITELHAQSGAAGTPVRLDADTVIERILEHEERLGRGRLVTVVSSDNRVKAAARAVRARTLSSEAFLRTLVQDLRKQHERGQRVSGGRPAHATDEGADPARTDYWLREFMGGPADASKPSRPDLPISPERKVSRPSAPEVDLNAIDMEQVLKQLPEPPRDQPIGTEDENERNPRRPRKH